MAAVHPVWKTRKDGSKVKRFQLDYYDAQGKRVRKNYATARQGNDERIRVEGQLAGGSHVADRDSITVGAGFALFLEWFNGLVKTGLREQSSWDQYDDHRNHVLRYPLAKKKLARLRTADGQEFLDAVTVAVSPEMAAKLRTTLSTVIDWCQQRALIAGNPIAAAKVVSTDRIDDEDQVDWPSKAEVAAIVATATGWAKPDHPHHDAGRALAMIMVGFFNGPRPSELFGLERKAASLMSNAPNLKIVQRLNRQGRLGAPKSKAGRRTLPLGAATVAALKAWITHGQQGVPATAVATGAGMRPALMLFPYLAGDDRTRLKKGGTRKPPTDLGKPMQYHIFDDHIWTPLLIEAGVTRDAIGKDGQPEPRPRFGPHYMRHVYATILAELSVPLKRAQVLMGHADVKLFLDTYGHLFEDPDQDAQTADAAEAAILGGK